MNDEGKRFFRETVIPALRSGTYKQTCGALHENDRYCVLGVVCDTVGVEWVPNYEGSTLYGATTGDGTSSAFSLPRGLARQFDVTVDVHMDTEVNAFVRSRHGFPEPFRSSAATLALLNDAGLTFDQLADVLEVALEHAWIRPYEERKENRD